MKNTLKIYCFMLLGISFTACSQKPETMLNQNQHITANNIVSEITKQLKQYPEEKIYGLRFGNGLCYFDMYVNGIKLNKPFNSITGSTAVRLNPVVFKSGTYKLVYKMYPLGKLEEIYGDEVFTTLLDNTQLKFDLGSYIQNKEGFTDVDYLEYSVPTVEVPVSKTYSDTKFIAHGQTYYEGSFDMEVNVPYEIQPPFENAQDLRKFDKAELEAKLLKKYKEVANIYQNKEYDNIARLTYDNLRIALQSLYATPEEVAKQWEMLFKAFKESSFEMQPIENYKLEFFYEGKLAALMLTTQDNTYRGNTALWAKVNYDGGTRPMFLSRYFYIPEGETEFKAY